jgi:hypothetical protein
MPSVVSGSTLSDLRRIDDAIPHLGICRRSYAHHCRANLKDAFAKAIEWHIVGKLADVAISDGSGSYSIPEFSSMMALAEIAKTIETALQENAQTKE